MVAAGASDEPGSHDFGEEVLSRVPLMGVTKRLHGTRLAGQIAYTLIEYIRRACVENYGVKEGEFGWVLEDNQGMMSIAELPGATVNHVYRIYDKRL